MLKALSDDKRRYCRKHIVILSINHHADKPKPGAGKKIKISLQNFQKALVKINILIYNVITQNMSYYQKGGIYDEKIIKGHESDTHRLDGNFVL